MLVGACLIIFLNAKWRVDTVSSVISFLTSGLNLDLWLSGSIALYSLFLYSFLFDVTIFQVTGTGNLEWTLEYVKCLSMLESIIFDLKRYYKSFHSIILPNLESWRFLTTVEAMKLTEFGCYFCFTLYHFAWKF